MLTIGIDPGLTGAIAFIGTLQPPYAVDMPVVRHSKAGHVKNAVDVVALARLLRETGALNNAEAFLERVNAFPGQGASSVFSLGMSFWGVAGVVAALGVPLHLVNPADWKRHYRLDKDKEMARALATRFYPEIDLSRKKDHGRAEALLIARYGREKASLL